MSTGFYVWSQTAATNATADSSINWAEGQAPSSVNDSSRAMMAGLAKWRDDISGSLTTGGTSTAYTLTTNEVFDSLAHLSGMMLAVVFHTASGASPTLAVDGLTAKAINKANGVAIGASDLVGSVPYILTYNNSDGVFYVQGAGAVSGTFPAGTLMLFQQTSAPTGWTKGSTHNDKALRLVTGTASSGGTTAFTTIFASRTLTQGNLPSYNLSTASLTGTVPVSLTTGNLATGGVSINIASASTSPVTFGGSIPSGGSGTAIDFAVQYVDLIIASKN